MRLASLLVSGFLVLSAPAAHATLLLYGFDLNDGGGGGTIVSGTLLVDDADFSPAASISLQAFDVNFPPVAWALSDCSTALATVNGAGTGLANLDVSCTETAVSNGTVDLETDGSFHFAPLPGLIEFNGSYTLQFLAVPEPAVPALAALAAALMVKRRRG